MAFLDKLKQYNNPSMGGVPQQRQYGTNTSGRGSSIAGVLDEVMPFIDQMRMRNLQDLELEQQVMQKPPLRQGRMINPNMGMNPNMAMAAPAPQQNTIFNPGMTDYQKANLGLEERRLAQQGRGIEQQGRIGTERAELGRERLELDTLKNKQIYETQVADMKRKSDEADARLKIAEDTLKQRGESAEATLAVRQAQIDALTAKHALQMQMEQNKFGETTRLNDTKIAQMQKAMADAGLTVSETELGDFDEAGRPRTRTTTTRKGETAAKAGTTVRVQGPIDPKTKKPMIGTVSAEDAKNLPPGWKAL